MKEDCLLPEAAPGALRGWRLSVASAGYFLMPPALGAMGAAALPDTPGRQVLGTLGGLVAGCLLAIAAARLFGRFHKEPL